MRTRRLATFTEANAWVHLAPEKFKRHFPYVSTIWKTEDGKVWVETDRTAAQGPLARASWERRRERSGDSKLPCGCSLRVAYVPRRRETICAFSNPAIAFRRRLRISGRLMLTAGALSRLGEALCVHPHDEATVEQRLER